MQDCGLAGAGGSDQSDRLACFNDGREIVKNFDLWPRRIAEIDLAELDSSSDLVFGDDLTILIQIDNWLAVDDLVSHVAGDLRLFHKLDPKSGASHGKGGGDYAKHDTQDLSTCVDLAWPVLQAFQAILATEPDCVCIEKEEAREEGRQAS